MMKFKVTYHFLDHDDYSYSVVFNSEYELLGGLCTLLSPDRIGTEYEVHIIAIQTIYFPSPSND